MKGEPYSLFQVAGSAIDPGSSSYICITAIHNSTDDSISAGIALSSSDNITLGENATLTFNPPLRCAKGETATPAAGVVLAYYITS